MVMSKNQATSEPVDTPDFLDNLLILNYVMDPADPALSHQVEIVEQLALKFNSVTVLTGRLNWNPTAPNIHVFSSNWRPGHNLQNVIRFYLLFFHLLRRHKFVSVFSHMTTVQSCLVGPILWLRRINHFLWYAHAQNSLTLKFAYFWVTKLVTSTSGSCPLSGKKILYLGQSIDDVKFKARANSNYPLQRFIHIGRADPSKNFHMIIEAVYQLRKFHSDLRLEFVGNPSGIFQNSEFINQISQFSTLMIKQK